MLEKAGKNSGDNRRDNRGLVLRMVATGACRTRRDLVVRTGLSKMTISNIVGEMIDGDVLRESEVVCSEEPGRNPVRLRLSPEAPKAAGVAFLPGRCERMPSFMKRWAHSPIRPVMTREKWVLLPEAMYSPYHPSVNILRWQRISCIT